MAGAKGRNGDVEDESGNEGQGQRKGLLILTADNFFRKWYPQKCWKITQETKSSIESIWLKKGLLWGQVLLTVNVSTWYGRHLHLILSVSMVSPDHWDFMPREPVCTTGYSELVNIYTVYIVSSSFFVVIFIFK